MSCAIYHFTDKSSARPAIYQKQLDVLRDFAVSKGLEVEAVYCDKSLKVSESPEFERFMSEKHMYSALVTKDFYHIRKNTGKCIKILRELRDAGITVHTLENGLFSFEIEPFEAPLRVATYTYGDSNTRDVYASILLQNDIYEHYVKTKTNWTLTKHYQDITTLQNDEEQVELMELIADRETYDIVLVNALCDIHWRTSRFCKIRELIGKPIYSLQDGYLAYKKE